jgi:hypothetical protein
VSGETLASEKHAAMGDGGGQSSACAGFVALPGSLVFEDLHRGYVICVYESGFVLTFHSDPVLLNIDDLDLVKSLAKGAGGNLTRLAYEGTD